VDQTETTMAELGEEEKNRVSHRGRAFALLLPVLRSVLAERAAQTASAG
jgi:inosine/xanthosine triphosphate pyrophosphatase family protein